MRLTGWRYVAFIGTFVSVIGFQSYLVMINPFINPEPYKIMQEEARAKFPERKSGAWKATT